MGSRFYNHYTFPNSKVCVRSSTQPLLARTLRERHLGWTIFEDTDIPKVNITALSAAASTRHTFSNSMEPLHKMLPFVRNSSHGLVIGNIRSHCDRDPRKSIRWKALRCWNVDEILLRGDLHFLLLYLGRTQDWIGVERQNGPRRLHTESWEFIKQASSMGIYVVLTLSWMRMMMRTYSEGWSCIADNRSDPRRDAYRRLHATVSGQHTLSDH